MRRIAFALLLVLWPYTTDQAPTHQSDVVKLQWAPCKLDIGPLQRNIHVQLNCAELNVPLDYTDPRCEQTLPLQLVKVNATKKPFMGSIIFNPGGPGVSGIEDLAFTGALYNSIIGGQYDLISFDPRGAGNTISFVCGIWNESVTGSAMSTRDIAPRENMTELLLDKDWRDSTRIADGCYHTQNETGRFVGTAFVARDIMQIVDALGEDGMLRYWGISYGTLLGATIASMFPDRIERMYLDSVVNPLDYMSGQWLTATLDSDHALLGFFEECVKAGPSSCAIANFSGPMTTPQNLLAATYAVFEELIQHPQYLPNDSRTDAWDKIPPLSLYEDIKQLVFQDLYSPIYWPELANALVEILAFDFSQYYNQHNLPIVEFNKGYQAFWGIACSDAAYRANSPEEMVWLVDRQQNVSGFSDLTSHIWPCYQWKMPAAERYTGNFTAKTSFPILFTNGHYDPITPYASAVNQSAGFEGSVIVTHGGHGHGFFSDPSLCTARAVRAYFVNGTMPKPNTYCAPEYPPFEINYSALSAGNWTFERRTVNDGDGDDSDEMLQAMYKLAAHYSATGPPRGFLL